MKTLVKNGISLIVLDDNTPVQIGDFAEIGWPVTIRFDNADGLITLHEHVNPPANYQGKRFLFDGTNWTYNHDWRNPNLTAAKR